MNQSLNEWKDRYTPTAANSWKGRIDGGNSKRIHEVIQTIDLKEGVPKLKFPAYGIVGFSSDEGVTRNLGRPGACDGPESLRKSLGKLPINMPEPCPIFDVGDIHCKDGKLSLSQEALGDVISQLLTNDIHPIAIGGGHEIAWGCYQGIVKAYPDNNITVLNFDAHFDLRPLTEGSKGTSGTSFTQIAQHTLERNIPFDYFCVGIQRYGNTKMLFDTAEKLHVSYLFADDIYLKDRGEAMEFINNVIETSELIYVTICLDVFSSSVAPGVSAPQALGLMPWQVIPLLRALAQSQKVVCLDIAELNPAFDLNSMTSELAALLVCDYIHHHNRRTQGLHI